MPNKLTAHKLNGRAKDVVCQMFAEFARPTEVQRVLRQELGIEVTLPTLSWYQRSARWSKVIEEKRKTLDTNIDRLPIASKYWRMRQRQQILEQARTGDRPDLSTARGLLVDAAKELGELKSDNAIGTQIGQLNVHLVQQVLQLPEEAQEAYIRTGRLPPHSYLSDVEVVEGEK